MNIKKIKLINSLIIPPCFVGDGAIIENSVIGPYVSVGEKSRISDSRIKNSIIQKEAKIVYENLPRIKGIRLLLHQVFYNLINNALKFSKANIPPIIKITATSTEKDGGGNSTPLEYVQIDIQDNGIGFNPAYADRMFGVFSRLNAKDKYEGTGLGLALCKKIVQRHGGEIWADGEEGVGSVFHIVLPLK